MDNGVWSKQCEVWNVGWKLEIVECGVWSGNGKVRSLEQGVWSEECGVWSVEWKVRSAKR